MRCNLPSTKVCTSTKKASFFTFSGIQCGFRAMVINDSDIVEAHKFIEGWLEQELELED
jgi:hypothetical protein